MTRATLSRIPPAHGVPEGEGSPGLRKEQRLCTLFRMGKLRFAGGVSICRVRNISSNGFMADACPAPAAGEPVSLELREGRARDARVAWAQGARIGAEFLEPQPISELIGSALRPHQRRRALRVAPEGASATILHGKLATRASILNISQTGAALFAHDLVLTAGARRALRIEIDGLETMGGILCWTRQGAAGIQFDRPLSFETLSRWLWTSSLAAKAVTAPPLAAMRPLHER